MRDRRILVGCVALAAATALCAACTSLLGDFTASDTSGDDGGLASDGANDVNVGSHDAGADGAPGPDGGNDANGSNGDAGQDAAAFLLHCAFSLPNPILIESLEGQTFHRYTGAPMIASLGDSEAIILEPSEGGHYTAFWVRPNDANSPVQGVYTETHGVESNDGVVYDFKSVTGGAGVLQGFTPPGIFGVLPQYFVSTWNATDFGGQAPSNSEQISGHVGQNSGGAAEFVETAPNVYAWTVVANETDGGNGTQVWAGIGTPDAGSINSQYLTDTPMHGGSPFVIHDGTKLRVFMGSSPDQGSTLEWTVPDDGAADGGVAARALGPGPDAGVPALLMAAGPAAGGGNLAFVDVNTVGAISATFHVGFVPSANLDTFVADDLPAGATISSASDLPINDGRSAWFGDDFAMIGLGQPPPQGGGINFVWFDSQGHQRAAQTGANVLLNGHKAVDGVAIALAQKIGNALVSWHLVWSEQLPGADGGLNDELFYQSLSCN